MVVHAPCSSACAATGPCQRAHRVPARAQVSTRTMAAAASAVLHGPARRAGDHAASFRLLHAFFKARRATQAILPYPSLRRPPACLIRFMP